MEVGVSVFVWVCVGVGVAMVLCFLFGNARFSIAQAGDEKNNIRVDVHWFIFSFTGVLLQDFLQSSV